jgi:AhpD family alkylhydroperoxidase
MHDEARTLVEIRREKGTEVRLDYRKSFPQALQAMLGLEEAVHESTLEPELLELVKLRASQLNGCAYCLDMHSKDARARGEGEQRLHVLAAWREAPFYSERERAALAWCEALTLLPQTGAPDEVYAQVRDEFDEQEVVALTLAIVAINGWNRFAVGLRADVGGYVSPLAGRQEAASELREPTLPRR